MKPQPAVFQITDRWRLTEDGELQWILQRENPKAKHERNRWKSVAYCGTREGLLEVALPHHGVIPSDAASYLLKSLPQYYEAGALERLTPVPLDQAA